MGLKNTAAMVQKGLPKYVKKMQNAPSKYEAAIPDAIAGYNETDFGAQTKASYGEGMRSYAAQNYRLACGDAARIGQKWADGFRKGVSN